MATKSVIWETQCHGFECNLGETAVLRLILRGPNYFWGNAGLDIYESVLPGQAL